jgi:hypothetical protein
LGRILIRFTTREPAPHSFYDLPGILRGNIDRPDSDHLLDSAFEQIRIYAKADVAVSGKTGCRARPRPEAQEPTE